MSAYVYGDPCPVCDRDIKRRPVELTGRPCVECSTTHVTPQDRYRLRNARLTPVTYAAIIDRAKVSYGKSRNTVTDGRSVPRHPGNARQEPDGGKRSNAEGTASVPSTSRRLGA